MISKKTWFWAVLAPLVAVLSIDQYSKTWASHLTEVYDYQWFVIKLLHNYGFMLGSMKDAGSLYTVVIPATLGGFIIFLLGVIQYFLPLCSNILRVGLTLFAAGVISNMWDRIYYGYVVDFILLRFRHFNTGIFNIADAVQWIGVFTFLSSYIAQGKIFFPLEQRRGRKWIDPSFQATYCAVLVLAGLGFSVIAALMGWAFLRVVTETLSQSPPSTVLAVYRAYLITHSIATTCYLIILLIMGIHLSHRAAGPIKAFEAYLNKLIDGHEGKFQLRKSDYFPQLESLADRFRKIFHDQSGITPTRLAVGDIVPQFNVQTIDKKSFSAENLLGQRTWLIFYRYSGCPLCAMHLSDAEDTISFAQRSGVRVYIVYETRPEEFSKITHPQVSNLISDLSLPVIADPDRVMYRAFRARRSLWNTFHPKAFFSLVKSQLRGFRQMKIVGSLGQLPAHFLVAPNGQLEVAFYGTHIAEHLDLEKVYDWIDGSDIHPQ